MYSVEKSIDEWPLIYSVATTPQRMNRCVQNSTEYLFLSPTTLHRHPSRDRSGDKKLGKKQKLEKHPDFSGDILACEKRVFTPPRTKVKLLPVTPSHNGGRMGEMGKYTDKWGRDGEYGQKLRILQIPETNSTSQKKSQLPRRDMSR